MMFTAQLCNRSWTQAVLHLRLKLQRAILGLALLAAGCAASVPPSVVPAGTGRLVIVLDGFRNGRGVAIVSLFAGPKGFPDNVAASVSTVSAAIHEGKAAVTFADLPYGEYAVSVLHDEDGDGEMATGLLGTPREGFGFSGDPDVRFGHPDFAAARFLLIEPQRELTIGIRYETGRRQHQGEGRASELRRPAQE